MSASSLQAKEEANNMKSIMGTLSIAKFLGLQNSSV